MKLTAKLEPELTKKIEILVNVSNKKNEKKLSFFTKLTAEPEPETYKKKRNIG